MAGSAVGYEVVQGVAVLRVQNPPVNSLSAGVRAGLQEGLKRAAGDAAVKAVVIIGDGKTFPAGFDISEFPRLRKMLAENKKPSDYVDLFAVVNQIENMEKPVVAAIHGTALGGGMEVTLGCHYRIALASAKMGLPEVQLGIIPGAGGTQRLPRLIGVPKAMQLITTGKALPAGQLLRLGALDFVLPKQVKDPQQLLKAAVGFALEVAARGVPLKERRVSQWPVLPHMPDTVFSGSKKMASKAARGYIAPLGCIDAIEAAATLPFDKGLQVEQQIIRKLVLGPQSSALQHVFFAQRMISRIPGIGKFTGPKIKSVGIIGAGTMGGGIAMNFIQVGIQVFLMDREVKFVENGIKIIRGNYMSSVKKGRMSKKQLEQLMSLVKPTTSYDDLKDCDMVIEAVFEDMNVKKQVLAALDKACKPSTILCTNTSTLDIDEIAAATKRPQLVVGTHFFSPANKMKLLENVRGSKTSPETIAAVMAMGQTIKKIAVLVGNCFGFVGNRMLEPYGREAAYLVEEGASIQQVDMALFKFGMPMGPFNMSDLAGNDIGYKIRKSLGLLDPKTRPKDERYHGTLGDKLVKMERLGMKTGKGWYAYKKGSRQPMPDPEVEAMVNEHRKSLSIQQRKISEEEILERCLYPLINVGFQCLEEGIAIRSSDIDIIYIFGYGFPPYRGGPMYYAEQVGLSRVLSAMEKYGKQHPNVSHWKPSALLRKLATEGISLAQYAAQAQKAQSRL